MGMLPPLISLDEEKNMNPSLRLFRLLLALLLSAAASLCAAQTYKITDLGDLPGGNFSQAQAINASGQVSGMAGDSSGNGVVFLYSSGKMVDLGSLGGGKAIGNGINKSAQIAGYSTNVAGWYRAFVTVDGKLVDIGDLGGGSSMASSLNDSGQVVGASYLANGGGAHPFLYSNGKMMDLGGLGGQQSWSTANGINNSGVVVGSSWKGDQFLGFVWKKGKMKALGTLGGSGSQAYAINNTGQITGAAYTTNSALHAFITTGGKLKDLGVISGSGSWGFAINDSGIVVGQSTYGQGGNYHAFVYNGRKMVDLNKLIPANSGWELYVANGVNDAGRIVGYGTRNGTTLQAFLLTPR
jgi:probable HAF family extracellular repeat protein